VRERQLGNFVIDKNLPKLKIVNRSGVPGLGAETKLKLQATGYEIVELTTDSSTADDRTVIIYPEELGVPTLRLSNLLDNALLSAANADSMTEEIVVFVGSDVVSN